MVKSNETKSLDHQSIFEKAVSGAIWITLEASGGQFISLCVFSVMARYLMPAEVGFVNEVYLVLISVKFLLFDNIASFLIRSEGRTSAYNTGFWMMAAIAGISAIALIIIAPIASSIIHVQSASLVIRGFGVVILITGVGRTFEAWMTAHFYFRSLAVRGLAGSTIGGTCGILLAMNGYGIGALVLQQVIGSAVSFALVVITAGWRPSLNLERQTFFQILKLMRVLVPNSAIFTLMQISDIASVAYFFGIEAAGYYSLAKRLRQALQTIANSAVTGVTLPALTAAQNDPERFNRVFLKGLRLICAICTPLFVGAAAMSTSTIGIIFGPRWSFSAPIFTALSLSAVPMTILGYCDAVLLVRDRTFWSLCASTLILLFSTIAMISMQKVPLYYVGISVASAYFLVAPMTLIVTFDELNLEKCSIFSTISPSLVSSTIMFWIIWPLQGWESISLSPIALFLLPTIGLLVYVASLRLIGKDDFKMVQEFVVTVFKKLPIRMRSRRLNKDG